MTGPDIVTRLRFLSENYDGIDAEDFGEAADHIEALEMSLNRIHTWLGLALSSELLARLTDVAGLIEDAYNEAEEKVKLNQD